MRERVTAAGEPARRLPSGRVPARSASVAPAPVAPGPTAGTPRPHRVVVVGGGFGGLYAARELGKGGDRGRGHPGGSAEPPPVPAAALPGRDRGPVAGGDRPAAALDLPQASATPRCSWARRLASTPSGARFTSGDGGILPYDTLIVATGRPPQLLRPRRVGAVRARPQDHRRRYRDAAPDPDRVRGRRARGRSRPAPGVDDLRDRGRRAHGGRACRRAGRDRQRHAAPDFRSIRAQDARIELIEALDRILPMYPPDRSASATAAARAARRHRAHQDARRGHRATASSGSRREPVPRRSAARTVLWAAGVLAASFGRAVAEAVGAETDRSGRIRVRADLTIPGHPEIMVVGDAAVQPWKADRPVPGRRAGRDPGRQVRRRRVILARLRGEPVTPVPLPGPRRRRRHRAAARRHEHRLAGAARAARAASSRGRCGWGSTSCT